MSPALPLPSACRACRRRIMWVPTEATGRPMPLDAASNPEGNVRLIEHGGGIAGSGAPPGWRARVLGPLERELLRTEQPDAELWMPHHATCPKWATAKAQKQKDQR